MDRGVELPVLTRLTCFVCAMVGDCCLKCTMLEDVARGGSQVADGWIYLDVRGMRLAQNFRRDEFEDCEMIYGSLVRSFSIGADSRMLLGLSCVVLWIHRVMFTRPRPGKAENDAESFSR